jgi:hypothetical protein
MNLYSKLRNLYEKKIELPDCDPEIMADLCTAFLADHPLKFIPTIEKFDVQREFAKRLLHWYLNEDEALAHQLLTDMAETFMTNCLPELEEIKEIEGTKHDKEMESRRLEGERELAADIASFDRMRG